MTDLREMFEDLARSPAPPSRLAAGPTYLAGRRRLRHRRTAAATAATVLAAATGIGVATAAIDRAAPGNTPVGSVDVDRSAPSGRIQWAGAADDRHLYLAYLACPDGSCPKTVARLVGSDDGGRTWTRRADAITWVGLDVLGPDVLVATGPAPTVPTVSTDGGRTWRATRFTEAPRAGDATALYCWPTRSEAACEITALDPAALTWARLLPPPKLSPSAYGRLPAAGGVVWVGGTLPGPSHRPAAAVSTDDGRTWTTHSFPEPAGCADHACGPPAIATVDGLTAYVVITDSDARQRAVYRVDANGSPRHVAGGAVPYSANGLSTFVLPDGTHVIAQTVSSRPGRDTVRFWGLHGDTYQPITLDGLPDTVYPVRRAPDGWYYTYSYGDDSALYGSADGRRWTRVAP